MHISLADQGRAPATLLDEAPAPLLNSGTLTPSARRPHLHVPASPDEDAFREFFEHHRAELARFAWLLVGDKSGAEDIAADAMLAVWKRWTDPEGPQNPEARAAYARGVVANLAKGRIRSAVRERRRNLLFWRGSGEAADETDVAGAVDVRRALARLPFRKRACVVLRHSLGLTEAETAEALGIAVGTVKSQTSKGLAELRKILRPAGGPDDRERLGNGVRL